jgi:CRISPR-associated endonuclease Cas2
MHFLVCYDIADPKRLKHVAKHLERHAQRIQQSVFLFTDKFLSLDTLMQELLKLSCPNHDSIQAWQLKDLNTLPICYIGTPTPIMARGFVVVTTAGISFDNLPSMETSI